MGGGGRVGGNRGTGGRRAVGERHGGLGDTGVVGGILGGEVLWMVGSLMGLGSVLARIRSLGVDRSWGCRWST